MILEHAPPRTGFRSATVKARLSWAGEGCAKRGGMQQADGWICDLCSTYCDLRLVPAGAVSCRGLGQVRVRGRVRRVGMRRDWTRRGRGR